MGLLIQLSFKIVIAIATVIFHILKLMSKIILALPFVFLLIVISYYLIVLCLTVLCNALYLIAAVPLIIVLTFFTLGVMKFTLSY